MKINRVETLLSEQESYAARRAVTQTSQIPLN
jgi:hypothetical protein